MERNEVVAADENLLEIVVFDRRATTPPAAVGTEPRRVVGGNKTKVEFVCGLYVDQNTGEIYGINNDTELTETSVTMGVLAKAGKTTDVNGTFTATFCQ